MARDRILCMKDTVKGAFFNGIFKVILLMSTTSRKSEKQCPSSSVWHEGIVSNSRARERPSSVLLCSAVRSVPSVYYCIMLTEQYLVGSMTFLFF